VTITNNKMVTRVGSTPTGDYNTTRLMDYNTNHTDTGTGTGTGTGIRNHIHNHIRIHIRIRNRAHNTYLPKNDDRGDKILVACCCIYLTVLTKIITIFYSKGILPFLYCYNCSFLYMVCYKKHISNYWFQL
jgi:hypothetical protein